MKQKVYACITRHRAGRTELLVFSYAWLFRWRWMEATEATSSLFGEQGHYLPQLFGRSPDLPVWGKHGGPNRLGEHLFPLRRRTSGFRFRRCHIPAGPDCHLPVLRMRDVTGANRLSLRQAQRNFARFGACDERALRHVRPSTPHDRRDPGWRPADS